MGAVDLAPIGDAFASLVTACPKRSATVAGAERAFTDACETIERNAVLLIWEAKRQIRSAAERAERERAEAADLARRKQSRADLAARAAAKLKGPKR